MTLILRSILILVLLASVKPIAFSQERSAAELYGSGESLLQHDFEKGFEVMGESIKVALETRDLNTYIKALNSLTSQEYYDRDREAEYTLHSLERSDSILKNATYSEELAQLYFRSASFYLNYTQQTSNAIGRLEKAKETWIALRGTQDADVAACYHELGDIYKYTTFDFPAAEKSYETALTIREQIGLKDPVILYRNYYSLAATNGSQRDFGKALSYGSKAVAIAETLGSRRQAQCAAMIANIYRDMGLTDLAKQHYLKALSLNNVTQDLDNKAWYYLCLGEMFKNEMQTDEALKYFNKAYDLYRRPDSRDQALFLSLLISMFDIYSTTHPQTAHSEKPVNNFQRNFKKLQKEIFQELASANMLRTTEAANTWLIIGKHHAQLSNYDSALISYQQALIASVPDFKTTDVLQNPTEDMVGFQYYVNEILTRKASALKTAFEKTADLTYLTKSMQSLKLAEKLLSKQRNTLDMEDSKWLFLEQNFDLYETIIENLYNARGQLHPDTIHREAFEYFERSKARSLADALTLTERGDEFNNQDTLFRVQTDLKRKLLSAQANITRGLEKSASSAELANYRNEIVELDRQIQTVKGEIEKKYPGYFNVKYGYGAIPLDEIKASLKKNDQVLLEYFWGSEGVYALGVTEDQTLFYRVGSPDSIKSLINTLLIQLTTSGSSTNLERYKQFCTSASSLYQKLMAPFAASLQAEQRIQIIPDGPISQVPFEVLLTAPANAEHVNYHALKYLIRSFPIGYAYSSSMLSRSAPKNTSTPSILAMGFTDGQTLGDSNEQLIQLAGAAEELKTLKQRFSSGKFLSGKDANEASFKNLAPDYDIIHLAVHGAGDVERNYAAKLYFGEGNRQEDGELHAYELYGLKLNALMAVLSSCESGLGKGYRGEGMISMATAFTYSGCENILMSLWKVNDQAAMKLMDDFYGFLLKGETIDVALRNTKLKYLEGTDEFTADPRIWTPLVAYGNLKEVFDNDRNNVLIYGGLILIAAIVLLTWKVIVRRRGRRT